ncbi:hypothetical protein SCAR479_08011 [Seiridium cardinale]|uniref:Uncharacterized protein n=1 Tax=Seiridium cardinale TaxID=138064 RepID=A0ABR2XNE9_9PEZI
MGQNQRMRNLEPNWKYSRVGQEPYGKSPQLITHPPPRESETPRPRFRRRTQPNYTDNVGPDSNPANNGSGKDNDKIEVGRRKRKTRTPRAKPKLPRKPADDRDVQLNLQQYLQHGLHPLQRDCLEAERRSPVVMLKSALPDGEGIEEVLADARTRFDQTADKVVTHDPSSNEATPCTGRNSPARNTADTSALFLESREGHRNNDFDFPRKDNDEYLQARRHAHEQLVYKLFAHEKQVEQGTWTLRKAMISLPPDRSMLIEQYRNYVESDPNEYPDEVESD